MKFLSYDGFLSKAIRDVGTMVVLNLCFWICSFPVVTMGAAITALYGVYLNREEESSFVRRFFQEFFNNFRKGTQIWLILLGIGGIFFLEYLALFSLELPGEGLIFSVLLILTVLFLSVANFTLALQARFENSVRQTLKNGLVLGTVGILSGVLTVLVSFFPMTVFFLAFDLLAMVLAVWIPLGVPLATSINARILDIVFRKVQCLTDEKSKA